jgi:glycosyltransferase involved in cell wall biosynthesis
MQLSILIRNLNEATALEQTLSALKKQQTDFEYEVVVVDNESEDNSAEVAKQFGAQVLALKREAFTFGRALNFGIEHCKGEFILILSAHVILLNEFFLKNIPSYFTDPTVAALRFVHAVSPGHVVDCFHSSAQRLLYSDSSDFVKNNWNNFIVNHCAAIRRSCWKQVPFNEQIVASEDKLWSLCVLKKGYAISYNVPCFYVYTKPASQTIKIKREIIERAAKEIITGEKDPLFTQPYFVSFIYKITSGFRRISNELKIQLHVYKGMKAYQNKYRGKINEE